MNGLPENSQLDVRDANQESGLGTLTFAEFQKALQLIEVRKLELKPWRNDAALRFLKDAFTG